MQRQTLEAAARQDSGKGAARRLRAGGWVPGVAYGSGVETLQIQVQARPLMKALEAGGATLLALSGVAPLAGRLCLVKELQRDPATRAPLHCDFYAVDLKRKIEVSIPIHVEGKAPGVVAGGVLEPMIRELPVKCLPLAIPDRIDVDVSALQIGDSIRVGDLRLPEGVEADVDPTTGVVHVIVPKAEVEAAPVAEEVPAEGEAAAAAAEGAEGEKPEKGEKAEKTEKPERKGKERGE
jgi:large subunit ribosomal protein L25